MLLRFADGCLLERIFFSSGTDAAPEAGLIFVYVSESVDCMISDCTFSLLTGDAFGVQEGRLSRYSVIRRLLRNKKVKKYRTRLKKAFRSVFLILTAAFYQIHSHKRFFKRVIVMFVEFLEADIKCIVHQRLCECHMTAIVFVGKLTLVKRDVN